MSDELLIVHDAPAGRQEFHFPADRELITLGRQLDRDVVIDEHGVSRCHARIVRQGEQWIIVDEGSLNHTYVNGMQITRQSLSSGDEVHLGATKLTVQLSTVAKPPRSSVKTTEQQEFISADMPAGSGLAEAGAGAGAAGRQSRSAGPSVIWSGDADVSMAFSVAGLDTDTDFSEGLSHDFRPRSGINHRRSLADRLWGIRLFQAVGEVLARGAELDAVLEGILTVIANHVPCERAVICLIDEATGDLVPRAVRGGGLGTTIPISRTIAAAAVNAQQAVLVEDARARYSDAMSICVSGIQSAICVPLYREGNVEGLIYADTSKGPGAFTSDHLELAAAVGLFGAVAIGQARMRDRLDAERRARERLARYSSPRVAARILAASEGDRMLADAAEVTVLFADLQGFTSLSERLPADEVVGRLNAVFTRFAECIFGEDGTLDKFMGDGMLAFFGAPLPQPDHARRALRAAMAMRERLRECDALWPEEPPLQVRIGINSGPVVVGDIGAHMRKDYTVVGDTVNIASRLEATVARAGQIVIGPRTAELLEGSLPLTALPPVILKGKRAPVVPWLVGEDPDRRALTGMIDVIDP